ncbi:hypothetical protein QBZ16_001586 [Prototheca wickerhamii]|uniref:Pyrroline-5-carboxylate reductase n=1 Tax=Prototheca wickerhamii TaxID=3111 RepID=A0AAD9IFS8_PROWI|nr:hypothetical protein QBZ16_001586 [Prototheca wickerhamii]
MGSDRKIGFIGAGQMAEALARGFINQNMVEAGNVVCTDPVEVRKEVFRSFGTQALDSNVAVAENSEIIFVAVKPQYVSVVLKEISSKLTEQHLIVSIAAGVTLAALAEAAGPTPRIIRVMPNTPCLVGETAAAMCLGQRAGKAEADLLQQLFESVGRIFRVEEKLLSAVTGLSGSGPAYVFLAIEALADGGVRSGLPRDVAQALAAQTVLGAAKLVLESGKHPGALKDMVTSPAGTTIAGVHELEKAGIRAAFMNAVYAATQRADELAE